MRILLDENLPHRLRTHLPGHEVVTAVFAGWSGIKNGELLGVAEHAGFELLITADRNLRYQQNMSSRQIALIELTAQQWPALLSHLEAIRACVADASPGSYQIVECRED